MEYSNDKKILKIKDFSCFLDVLKEKYKVIAPTVRDGAILYEPITSVNELPEGLMDIQEAGKFRLVKRNDKALFGYAMSCDSWKKYLFPPEELQWKALYNNGNLEIVAEECVQENVAFMGVRSCELHAISIQDKIFLNGTFVENNYKKRRSSIFIIAVNCMYASNNCFCTSMNTGPEVTHDVDILLTEILVPEHYFVIEARTDKGKSILQKIPNLSSAKTENEEMVQQTIAKTVQNITKKMDVSDIKELLYRNYESPVWEDVATRCLTCTNCTMVCPTCFCHTVEDVTDLTGTEASRTRKWDSCFNENFSYIHGGSVRSSVRSRYRQWLTHKLATWIDQFGSSGCVGCGRCIAWCPAKIDITEEVKSIREQDKEK